MISIYRYYKIWTFSYSKEPICVFDFSSLTLCMLASNQVHYCPKPVKHEWLHTLALCTWSSCIQGNRKEQFSRDHDLPCSLYDTNLWRWPIWGWRITRSYTLSIVLYRTIRWRSNIALEKSWNSLSHCTMHHNMASTTAMMPMMSSSVPGTMWSNTYSHRSSFYRWVPLTFWKCRMPHNTEDYKNHQKHTCANCCHRNKCVRKMSTLLFWFALRRFFWSWCFRCLNIHQYFYEINKNNIVLDSDNINCYSDVKTRFCAH